MCFQNFLSKTVIGLRITYDSIIEPFKINIDYPATNNKVTEQDVIESMKTIYYCDTHHANVAKAIYPDQSHYHAFYISGFQPCQPISHYYHKGSVYMHENNKNDFRIFEPIIPYHPPHIPNKLASHIINDNYDGSQWQKNFKSYCYGDCIIIHFDQFMEFYDSNVDAFVASCNKIHTINGMQDRTPNDKIYFHSKSSKYYCYDDYQKIDFLITN